MWVMAIAAGHAMLVHAALHAAAPSLVFPAWLNEGMAEWFEARATGKRSLSQGERSYLAQAASQGQLFSLASMSRSQGIQCACAGYHQSFLQLN